MKTCKSCNTDKPLTEFHKRKESKDGHQSYCKNCASLHVVKWRASPPRIPMPPIGIKKTCRECGIDKDITQFAKTSSGYLRGKCKQCRRQKQRQTYNTLKAG